jgi:hypothetical protein
MQPSVELQSAHALRYLTHRPGCSFSSDSPQLYSAGADGGGHGAGDEKDGDDGVELSGVKDSPQLWRSVSLAAATLGVRHPGQGVSLPGAGDGAAEGGAHSDADPVVTADALAGAAQRLAWLAGVAPDERVRVSLLSGMVCDVNPMPTRLLCAQARVAAAAAEAADIPDAFPLGFELADKALGRPAALLRARHVAELRALQSRVDAALVAAQECTADPRTDTRLGRVGR